jgi:hypothetical protein
MNETTDQTQVQNGSESGKQRLKSASRSTLAPCSSVLEDSDELKQVAKLLKEAVKLKTAKSEADDRLEEIETELTAIAMIHNLKGFRHGLAGFEDRGWQSRNTLNKQKLVAAMAEYGAPANLIDACYDKGREFHDTRIVIFDLE